MLCPKLYWKINHAGSFPDCYSIGGNLFLLQWNKCRTTQFYSCSLLLIIIWHSQQDFIIDTQKISDKRSYFTVGSCRKKLRCSILYHNALLPRLPSRLSTERKSFGQKKGLGQNVFRYILYEKNYSKVKWVKFVKGAFKKVWSDIVLLIFFFKGRLPQILSGPFLNSLPVFDNEGVGVEGAELKVLPCKFYENILNC